MTTTMQQVKWNTEVKIEVEHQNKGGQQVINGLGVEKKYNFVYQTKNLINGKLYIGVHCTNNMDDGYIGCGVRYQKMALDYKKYNYKSPFISAVIKYGYENFKMIPMCFFETKAEAYEEEMYLLDEEWLKRTDTYNISFGGSGKRTLPKYWEKHDFIQSEIDRGVSKRQVSKNLGIPNMYLNTYFKNPKQKKKPVIKCIEPKYKIFYIDSQEVYYFQTLKDISRFLNVDYDRLRYYYNNEVLFMDNIGIFDVDREIIREIPQKEFRTTRYSGMKIINKITGEMLSVINSYQTAKYFNNAESTIRRFLNGKTSRFRDWVVFKK